jgi:hypothetical protein
MTSEWMKVMLEEIARKKAEAAQAQIERARRELKGASPPQQAEAPAAAHADAAARADKG